MALLPPGIPHAKKPGRGVVEHEDAVGGGETSIYYVIGLSVTAMFWKTQSRFRCDRFSSRDYIVLFKCTIEPGDQLWRALLKIFILHQGYSRVFVCAPARGRTGCEQIVHVGPRARRHHSDNKITPYIIWRWRYCTRAPTPPSQPGWLNCSHGQCPILVGLRHWSTKGTEPQHRMA